jgi:diacylglycerol kinase family enzyme
MKHRAHFQVDGESMGKVNRVEASIIPQAIKVIVPVPDEKAEPMT